MAIEGDLLTVSIPVGQAKSNAFGYGAFFYGTFIVPSNITNTTITFEVSNHPSDTAQFKPAYDSGALLISMTVAAGRAYPIPAALAGAQYIRIVEGANQATTPAVFAITRTG